MPFALCPSPVDLSLPGYPWPGNVRELEDTVERLILSAVADHITTDELPGEIRTIRAGAGSLSFNLPEDGIDLEEVEKEIIRQTLEKNDWNQTRAAKYLNITRNTLIYKI